MVNFYKYLLPGVFTVLISVFYSGCDSDTIINGGGNTKLFGGYDPDEAGRMMTLSALCYVAEGNTNALQVRDSIMLQLSDSNYSTRGQWQLVWGPGLSLSGGNLMYVAVDSTSDTIYYALCVRGTIFSFADIVEDLEVWDMLKWPYSAGNDSVAEGSLKGLDTLLVTTDPVSGQSLNTFLNSLTNSKQKMFVTGHSLGGAMATLLTRWFVDMGFTSRFKLESYTFAAPTVGNVSFVSSFESKLLSVGAENHRCVNTKDVVPYAWTGLSHIVPNSIPTQVPGLVAATIQTAEQYLRDSGIVYKHVETKRELGSIDPAGCGPVGEYETYFCWVGFEHASNTYLRLLNADTINWGNPHRINRRYINAR